MTKSYLETLGLNAFIENNQYASIISGTVTEQEMANHTQHIVR